MFCLVFFVFLSLIARPVMAQSVDLPGFVHDGVLTLCTNPVLPPMTFMDHADGAVPTGVDIDLARALATHWHVRLDISSMDFAGLFPALMGNRCSLVASGVARLPSRERNFDAVPYLDTAMVVVAPVTAAPIAGMEDLSGQHVAVQAGTSYAAMLERQNEILVARHRLPIEIDQYPTEDAVVQQVLLERDFAFISQDVEVSFRQKQLHGRVHVILRADDPDYRQFALYIRKNPHDRDALRRAVGSLSGDGQLNAIIRRWSLAAGDATALSSGHGGVFAWHDFFSALTSLSFLRGAALTLGLALASHATAIVISVPMALRLDGRPGLLRSFLRLYVYLFRAVPTLLQLLFVWNALPQFCPVFRHAWFTPFLAAWISLSLNESAYQVEINRSALASVDAGQIAAARALGMRGWQIYRHVIFPQALRIALPPTINDFITLLKTTSLASVISLHELLSVAQVEVARSFEFTEYYAAALVYYLLMVLSFIMVQKWMERRFGWDVGHVHER
ncbi:ABC transporter substrate-binding protein/permease [Novacetimonas pomaceti]